MIQEICKCEFCAQKFDEISFSEHFLNCDLRPIDCENDCGVKVYQRDIYNHKTNDCIKRIVICQHCNESLVRICVDDHFEICPKIMIKCPHDCITPFILREDLNTHFENFCTVLTKPCSFKYANCMFRGTDIALEKHLHGCTAEHLQLLGKRLQQTDEKLTVTENNLSQTIDKLSETVRKLTITENKLAMLEINFLLSTRFKGGFLWKIDNWNSRKIAGTYGVCVWSPEFYTSHHGYKMMIEIYTNEWVYEEETHLSLSLHIVSGDYDDELHWPFSHKLTISLINQTYGINHTKNLDPSMPNSDLDIHYDDECFKRPGKLRNCGIRYSKFISNEQFNNGNFIKDDTVCFKLYVEDT